jgi:hypothetical protein
MCQPPTGYADTAEAWVNTGALVARMNLALRLTSNRLQRVSVDAEIGSPSIVPWRAAMSPTLTLGSPEFQRR